MGFICETWGPHYGDDLHKLCHKIIIIIKSMMTYETCGTKDGDKERTYKFSVKTWKEENT